MLLYLGVFIRSVFNVPQIYGTHDRISYPESNELSNIFVTLLYAYDLECYLDVLLPGVHVQF